jgi:hypothetical protein
MASFTCPYDGTVCTDGPSLRHHFVSVDSFTPESVAAYIEQQDSVDVGDLVSVADGSVVLSPEPDPVVEVTPPVLS